MKLQYIFSATFVFVSICVFYFFQNNFSISGGEISLAKASWLGVVIFCWFFVPLLIIVDSQAEKKERLIYLIFFINMLLRGLIELYLMYIGNDWKYEYGISHNIFSIALLTVSWIYLNRKSIITNYLQVLIAMFLVEIYFAKYMLDFFGSQGGEKIWFLPLSDEHLMVNIITLSVVSATIVWQIWFYKKWVCR
jgi:hypothetical protein